VRALEPYRSARPVADGRWWLAILVVACGMPASAAGQTVTRGFGEGEPPQRPGLSPAQRRLMARRAAEVRAVRDALAQSIGASQPTSAGSDRVEVGGQVAGFRVIGSQELPDGRWRAVVEIEAPAPAQGRTEWSVSAVLTGYLQFRSGMLASRQRCLNHEARLQRELAEAMESVRGQIDAELRVCRADIALIERALADLEEKTANRLTGLTPTSSPSE
jgi:hypothetical protein